MSSLITEGALVLLPPSLASGTPPLPKSTLPEQDTNGSYPLNYTKTTSWQTQCLSTCHEQKRGTGAWARIMVVLSCFCSIAVNSKGLFHQEGCSIAFPAPNSHSCSGTVTDVPCFPGPSFCIASPGLRGGFYNLHFQKLSQQQTPAGQDVHPQPPNHKHSVHKSSTVPSHSISPAPR